MHLLIDVGNTRIKWVFITDEFNHQVKIHSGSIQDLSLFICSIEICTTKVLLAAVNQTTELTKLLMSSGFKSVSIAYSQANQQGIENSYQQPERMGVDRWLAMIAAHNGGFFTDTGCGKIVVDAGSAMTVDVLNEKGLHLGGYIVPGLAMAQAALFSNAEQVNRYVEPSQLAALNSNNAELGKNTVQCVEYGVVSQLIALIKSVVSQYPDYKLIVTGGDGELLAGFLDDCMVDSNLVLKGLWQVRN